MKKKVSFILKLLIVNCLIFVALCYIGKYSFNAKLVIGSIVYFIGPYLIYNSKRFTNKTIPFLIITGPLIFVFLYFNVRDFQSTSFSLPSTLFILLSSILAFYFTKTKNYSIPVLLCLCIISWLSYFKTFYYNKIIYKSFTQKVSVKYPQVTLYDSTGKIVDFKNKDKFYVLDFWNSRCGVCFRKFPYVDSISKIIDNNKVEILALNIPLQNENKDEKKIIDSFNYKFKKIYAANSSVADSFNVSYFPTTVVVKNNEIIYRGGFEKAISVLNLIKE